MSLGFYRGNKKALLANALLVNGHEPGNSIPGGNGAWVKPDVERKAEAMRDDIGIVGVGEKIGTTDVGPAKMKREHATSMGYTGDACDHCGSMKMKRTGHCNTCEDCGTTTGCS